MPRPSHVERSILPLCRDAFAGPSLANVNRKVSISLSVVHVLGVHRVVEDPEGVVLDGPPKMGQLPHLIGRKRQVRGDDPERLGLALVLPLQPMDADPRDLQGIGESGVMKSPGPPTPRNGILAPGRSLGRFRRPPRTPLRPGRSPRRPEGCSGCPTPWSSPAGVPRFFRHRWSLPAGMYNPSVRRMSTKPFPWRSKPPPQQPLGGRQLLAFPFTGFQVARDARQ